MKRIRFGGAVGAILAAAVLSMPIAAFATTTVGPRYSLGGHEFLASFPGQPVQMPAPIQSWTLEYDEAGGRGSFSVSLNVLEMVVHASDVAEVVNGSPVYGYVGIVPGVARTSPVRAAFPSRAKVGIWSLAPTVGFSRVLSLGRYGADSLSRWVGTELFVKGDVEYDASAEAGTFAQVRAFLADVQPLS